jgi:hypothetical protein
VKSGWSSTSLLAVETFDVIDVVVSLGLAGIAVVLAGVLFLHGRRDETVTVRGRTLRHPGLWAMALVLLGAVLVLRAAIEIVPAGWQGAVIAATLVAAATCIAVLVMALGRSRRP